MAARTSRKTHSRLQKRVDEYKTLPGVYGGSQRAESAAFESSDGCLHHCHSAYLI